MRFLKEKMQKEFQYADRINLILWLLFGKLGYLLSKEFVVINRKRGRIFTEKRCRLGAQDDQGGYKKGPNKK